MNRLTLTGILVLFLFIAGSSHVLARANYVIIGVFKNKDNAVHFTEAARTHNLEANYALNKVRQLYYVFVLYTEDVDKAIAEVQNLRANTEYTGAWIYHGVLGEDQVQDGIAIKTSYPTDEHPPAPPAPLTETVVKKDSVAAATVEAPQPVVVELPDAGQVADPKALTKLFVFRIFTPDQKAKDGNIEVIDVDRQKKANVVKGNEPVVIKSINSSGDLRFDCQVAGYRRVTQTINFKNPKPTETGITFEDNVIVVPFELTRLKKGDKSILYNIYFYKDAAIMRPESKYELDELLAMMNENDKYRIRVHGHTNGKASGKIIQMGESKNFFSLTGSQEGFGSAKKLSEERALVITEYLISEGIPKDRMEIRAWGGKKPIYERDHAQASSNVRVEIEILQD